MRKAQYTETCNAMISPEQRAYVDYRERTEHGVSRSSLVRDGLDLLMQAEPREIPSD